MALNTDTLALTSTRKSRSLVAHTLPVQPQHRLQLSTPDLGIAGACEYAVGKEREENQPTAFMQSEYKVPYSRSFNERSGGDSRPGSTVDTRHVRLYLRRQGSRTSVYSSASAGLATSDNGSLVSSSSQQSRPVSAESNLFVQKSIHTAQANTRIVVPNAANRPSHVPQPPIHPTTPLVSSVLTRSTSIPTLRRRSSYLDKSICQILEFLFMGGIEAGYNEHLLCRLNIEYILDISNVEPLKVPRNKRSDCPCLCSLETAHSRARMTIMIDENSQLDLVPYFDDVNQFIDSARTCGKNVLVHSYNGRNRCAALVIQYLMKAMNFNFEKAMEFVKSRKNEVEMKENCQKSLRKWETILQQNSRAAGVPRIGGHSGYRGPSTTANNDKFQIGAGQMNGEGSIKTAKRAAWM